MNKLQANKIIAEFMGWVIYCNYGNAHFKEVLEYGFADRGKCTSLDALVPVWEKLDMYPDFDYDGEGIECCLLDKLCNTIEEGIHSSDNYQESGAIATAKAIKALK